MIRSFFVAWCDCSVICCDIYVYKCLYYRCKSISLAHISMKSFIFCVKIYTFCVSSFSTSFSKVQVIDEHKYSYTLLEYSDGSFSPPKPSTSVGKYIDIIKSENDVRFEPLLFMYKILSLKKLQILYICESK